MGLITQTIDSFIGGVSQQPDILRFPNQVEELINGYPNEVDGLQKRPPLVLIKRLRDAITSANVKWYYINRDDNEQYVVAITPDGSFHIWDKEGNSHSCSFADNEVKAYVTCSNPRDNLKLLTIADYTLIANRGVTVGGVTGSSDAGLSDTSLVYVKNVNYGKTFAIFIDGEFAVGVFTPDGTDANDASQTTCAYVAQHLYRMLAGESFTPTPSGGNTYDALLDRPNEEQSEMIFAKSSSFNFSNYTYSFHGDSLIAIKKKDGSRPKIVCKDGFGNQNMLAFMGACQSTTKLPPIAPDGYVLEVTGESNSDDDNYYVKWVDSKGIWQECVKPNMPYVMPQKTLPVALVRQSDGSFLVKWNNWIDRGVGDDETNPEPSFIGSSINDIFFYRSRLGFVTDDAVVLSATNDFFNFWFNSATTVIDTDPVDVGVSSNKVVKLTNAVPFNRELMLFSKEEQFVLSTDGVLSPKSVKCDKVTSFDYDENVKPLNIGSNVFFVNDKTNHCTLMRYYTKDDSDGLKDALDVTAHVPNYLPKKVIAISGNSTENTILCTSASNIVYGFKFIIQNTQTIQQAWFKWIPCADDEVVELAEWVGSTVYFVINSPKEGLFLLKATLTSNLQDFEDEPDYRCFMDFKVQYDIPESAKYSNYYNTTTLSFKDVYGVVPESSSTYYLITSGGELHVIDSWDEDTGEFKLAYDARGTRVYIGRAFEFNTQLSKIYIKQANTTTGGYKSVVNGRLQLRYFWLNYSKSGLFDVTVDNFLKNKHFCYTYTGRTLDESPTILGVNKVFTGKYKFPVQENAEETHISIISNNAQPLNIVSAGYEGLYVKRGSTSL